ncbi:MAG: hypothetical protein JWO48_3798 [Bryobacterales bacterium]|nr:hypothetical protein [Bryobacterales bacterium]
MRFAFCGSVAVFCVLLLLNAQQTNQTASEPALLDEFFASGIVDPPNRFDPARLDPNNPPPASSTIQASNPQLSLSAAICRLRRRRRQGWPYAWLDQRPGLRNRDIKPEDVKATIYSAVGINCATVRKDDPFGRGLYYVPFSDQNVYEPIDELWG